MAEPGAFVETMADGELGCSVCGSEVEWMDCPDLDPVTGTHVCQFAGCVGGWFVCSWCDADEVERRAAERGWD